MEPKYYQSRSSLDENELKCWISGHMMAYEYQSPCKIVSFTASLLWVLCRARFLLTTKGMNEVQLFLIDIQKPPQDVAGYPAAFHFTVLEIGSRNRSYHDDPYHEYLLFGRLDKNADAVIGRHTFSSFSTLLSSHLYYPASTSVFRTKAFSTPSPE
jgi:hypothetical protein